MAITIQTVDNWKTFFNIKTWYNWVVNVDIVSCIIYIIVASFHFNLQSIWQLSIFKLFSLCKWCFFFPNVKSLPPTKDRRFTGSVVKAWGGGMDVGWRGSTMGDGEGDTCNTFNNKDTFFKKKCIDNNNKIQIWTPRLNSNLSGHSLNFGWGAIHFCDNSFVF